MKSDDVFEPRARGEADGSVVRGVLFALMFVLAGTVVVVGIVTLLCVVL